MDCLDLVGVRISTGRYGFTIDRQGAGPGRAAADEGGDDRAPQTRRPLGSQDMDRDPAPQPTAPDQGGPPTFRLLPRVDRGADGALDALFADQALADRVADERGVPRVRASLDRWPCGCRTVCGLMPSRRPTSDELDRAARRLRISRSRAVRACPIQPAQGVLDDGPGHAAVEISLAARDRLDRVEEIVAVGAFHEVSGSPRRRAWRTVSGSRCIDSHDDLCLGRAGADLAEERHAIGVAERESRSRTSGFGGRSARTPRRPSATRRRPRSRATGGQSEPFSDEVMVVDEPDAKRPPVAVPWSVPVDSPSPTGLADRSRSGIGSVESWATAVDHRPVRRGLRRLAGDGSTAARSGTEQFDSCPSATSGQIGSESRAEDDRPFLHSGQSESGVADPARYEADPVVADRDLELPGPSGRFDPDRVAAGVRTACRALPGRSGKHSSRPRTSSSPGTRRSARAGHLDG